MHLEIKQSIGKTSFTVNTKLLIPFLPYKYSSNMRETILLVWSLNYWTFCIWSSVRLSFYTVFFNQLCKHGLLCHWWSTFHTQMENFVHAISKSLFHQQLFLQSMASIHLNKQCIHKRLQWKHTFPWRCYSPQAFMPALNIFDRLLAN